MTTAVPAGAGLVPGDLVFRFRAVNGPPVVAVRAWLASGARVEATPGQALLTGRALAEGSRQRDWRRIADDAEALGAVVTSSASFEAIGVSVDTLAPDWEKAVDWAAEVLAEATFPADRVAWLARQAAAELESLGDMPDVRTGWAFLDALYRPHPRSRPLQGSLETLATLSVDDCRAFHTQARRAGAVIVTGAIDPATAEARVRERFAGLVANGHDGFLAPPDPAGTGPARSDVILPPGDQAHLFAGCLTVPRAHPDHLALEVLGVVLGSGSGLSGRFPERLRERLGLAYSVQVQTIAGSSLDRGRFVVYLGTSPDTVEKAEIALRGEIARLLDHGVTGEELEDARSYLLGRDAFRRETARQWADLLGDAVLYGTLDDDPAARRLALSTIRREELDAAAQRHLGGELVVTVGRPGG